MEVNIFRAMMWYLTVAINNGLSYSGYVFFGKYTLAKVFTVILSSNSL